VDTLALALSYIVVLIFSVIVHECSHGIVALALGDTTARDAGRLTLNPLPHVDPIGSILLPGILFLLRTGFMFGYAKPVPVRFDQLRYPRGGGALVGVAGPASNLLLALIAALSVRTVLIGAEASVGRMQLAAVQFLSLAIQVNVGLALFNMLPVPPADGSRLVEWLLPESLASGYRALGRYGMVIMLILVSSPGVLRAILLGPFHMLLTALSQVAGVRL
jgi:Zn-dependent protease